MEDKSNIIQEAIVYKEKLEKEVVRLRQTLQEIKEITENIQTDFTVKYDRKVNKAFTQILQKIAESEG